MRKVQLHRNLKEAKKSLLSFYLVGTLGMLIPWSSPLFKWLIPYSLLFCFVLLAFFHRPKPDGRTLLFFLFVFVTGFGVEVLGVATGQLFGSYEYGEHLGFKLAGTPLIIGLNWLFLVYTTTALTQKWKVPALWKVLVSSLAMVLYDLVAEQVAPALGMWRFEGGGVPLQNYTTWFGMALLFHSLLHFFKIRISNPLSIVMLTLQFLFFVVLLLFLPKG